MRADAARTARRRAAALARRVGWVSPTEHARVTAELASLHQQLVDLEEYLSAPIRELHEWSTNQDREIRAVSRGEDIDQLRQITRELSARLGTLQPARLETDRALFLALQRLREVHAQVGAAPARDDARGALAGHELRAFSQHGEDGVIAEILRRIGAPERAFVEFGVETGREGNCIVLADICDYSGLFIEADDRDFAELAGKYSDRTRIAVRHELVTPDNVERIFTDAGVPTEPDVLSIDVDGSDYWIWEAVRGFRPRLVVIEYNATLPADRRLVQPRELPGGWDGTDYYGASLGAIRSLGAAKGYRLVHVDLSGLNAFLVRDDLADGHFPAEDAVTGPGRPNYFHVGYRHPRDPDDRPYLDLDTGEPARVGPA